MSRTFTPLAGSGVGSAYAVGDKFGYQSAEVVRQALDIAMYCGVVADLGGSEDVGVITGAGTWQPVRSRRALSINGDNFGGLTLECVAYYLTSNASTNVQVRLRNVSDSSNAALGAASNSTTVVEQVIAVTLASGVKSYRLELLGDATNDVFAWGYIRFRKVPT